MFSCCSSNSSESAVSGAQMSPEKPKQSRVEKSPPLEAAQSAVSRFVRACPSSSNRGQDLSAFPVSKSGCSVALRTVLPVPFFFCSAFLSAGPGRNKLGKQAQEKLGHRPFSESQTLQWRDSFLSSQSPLCVSASLPPLGRVNVCLCAEGFYTAIQALPLPWHWMPYKARGVKEHRVGCSHTYTHTERMPGCLTGCLFPPWPRAILGAKGELTPTLP